jgi:hypothetical protein
MAEFLTPTDPALSFKSGVVPDNYKWDTTTGRYAYDSGGYADKVKAGEGYYGPSGQAIMDNAYASGDQGQITAAENLKTAQQGTGHGWAIENTANPTNNQSGGILTGAQASGYEPTGYQAADRANVERYEAPGVAKNTGYDATRQNMTAEQRSAHLLNQMIAGDSEYMQQARHDGLTNANSRGLLNTSLSAEAAQSAAIRAAAPFAMQDAQSEFTAARDFANAQNRASEFGASASNVAELAHTGQEADARRFNAGSENLANREFTASTNRASEFSAAAINRAGEFYAGAQNAASITNANNELSLALAGIEDELSTYRTDVQRATALDGIAANLLQTGMNAGVFNNVATATGFMSTISNLIPDLGIQIVTDLATTAYSDII